MPAVWPAWPPSRTRRRASRPAPVVAPVAAYVPAVRSGDLVFTSGQLPMVDGELPSTGKVGAQVTPEQAKDLARTCALNGLAAIDALVDRAVAAGADEGKAQDLGFMRSRSFADPDGHAWEVLWMDPIAQTGDWEAVQAKYGEQQPA